ncbi:acyltransferase family protein [Erythrobacter sp. HA6-11]
MPRNTDATSAPRTLGSYRLMDNGFDTIRLLAAIVVIFSHAFPITGLAEPLYEHTGYATYGTLAVCAFFVISGFLIPASRERNTLASYAMKRARRIMPALICAVFVCAFVIGPLLTTLPLSDYLTAKDTWAFVGHILFLPVGFALPGVFTDNPSHLINGSLWTLKYEVACYFAVPILFMFAKLRKAAVISAWLSSFAITLLVPEGSGGALYLIGQTCDLFRFFGSGMMMYIFRDYIPIRNDWAIAGLLTTIAGAIFAPAFLMEIAAVAGAYALMVFAYHSPEWFRRLTAKGDISYGVYVYAVPIQQLLLSATFAVAAAVALPTWIVNSVLTLPVVFLAGALSWRFIEKPALSAGRKRSVRPTLSSA